MTHTSLEGPASIASGFVDAWTRRDADKLASLFDEDAEFVNVTGLWWHDREAIRKAHAYGFEHIFATSTLRLIQVKVKSLADDIAVVHARLRLEGHAGRRAGRTTQHHFIVCRPSARRTLELELRFRTEHRYRAAYGNEPSGY